MKPAEYQVTEWCHPDEKIRTSWGTIYCREWLQLEALRWKQKWRQAWVEANSEGLVALFSLQEYMQPLADDSDTNQQQ